MPSIWFCRRLALAALVVTVVPAGLQAQERTLGTFSGRVDKEVRLTMRGGDVSSNTLSGADIRTRYRIASPLPQQEGTVRVAVTNGRGDVSVIQQPTAANGYTAVVRIFDRSSGADVYRVSTYWTPSTVQLGDRRGFPGRGRRADVPTLHWSGDVDGSVELRWRGNTVNPRGISGAAPRNISASVTGEMNPRQEGQVSVNVREGRGRVEVLQQPSAANRYTTIVRITDPARGYGHYSIDASRR